MRVGFFPFLAWSGLDIDQFCGGEMISSFLSASFSPTALWCQTNARLSSSSLNPTHQTAFTLTSRFLVFNFFFFLKLFSGTYYLDFIAFGIQFVTKLVFDDYIVIFDTKCKPLEQHERDITLVTPSSSETDCC